MADGAIQQLLYLVFLVVDHRHYLAAIHAAQIPLILYESRLFHILSLFAALRVDLGDVVDGLVLSERGFVEAKIFFIELWVFLNRFSCLLSEQLIDIILFKGLEI